MKPKFGLFTVFGFYKVIDDLIFTMNDYRPNRNDKIVDGPDNLPERLISPDYYDPSFIETGSTHLPFNNTEKAYVKGLEFSWQTNFWYLPGLLRGLVLDINYSIIHSETKYPFFKNVVVDVDESGFIPKKIFGHQYNTRKGPMIDQPESILNIILGWDYKGFSSRLSFRYQSKTVEGLDSRYSTFDRYYDTFSLIDLMLKQKISKNVSGYVNLTNIGNHIDEYYFGKQEGRSALPTSAQFYGFRAQFGVRVYL
jgi:outer membrane receptor protein involved in Fe transport